MKLKNLLFGPEETPRYSEVGRRIGETRQTVFAALNQDLDRCQVGTIRKYARAIGREVELIAS